MSEKKNIKKKDKDFLWHPFTKIDKDYDPIVITKAKDDILIDIDGKKYIDLISSWWVNIHGHCRKEIVQSISMQSEKLEQVLFADFTHSPAVNLAEKLISILPSNLSRVFYSDNGSTAVEIAMKVAIQYWYNLGKKKKKFVSMSGGYHGDTFGAMSVGYSSGFYKPFKDFISESIFIPFPDNWDGKNDLEKEEIRSLNTVDEVLSKNQEDIAAVIFEPLIQGAGGMKVCRKEFFDSMLKKFRDAGVIIIFDEVMTGFGRTGKMFAADYLKNKPDIMCLAKSMTGGYIPLAATIFSEKIHNEFLGGDIKKSFLHGHSFSANPIACSAALTSINLFNKENTLKKISIISEIHKEFIHKLRNNCNVSKTRILGSIAAFDFNKISKDYGSSDTQKIKKKFLENGLLLRPLGNTIYLMPPYCIKEETLKECYKKIIDILM
ncbi:MAG: adenosylmethionine--8-amino-7-oxononanoate transaminase [alpha proteobacterium MED-G10]|nr:MAG: adenosylmethionine--8-amino-7-oxononanoate transaminase [alpha proteobacterium MED-G10]|tara:strand:+ start:55 stop:1359 length:1305 start_codon:yes stop_codon:yes gene_type:complete